MSFGKFTQRILIKLYIPREGQSGDSLGYSILLHDSIEVVKLFVKPNNSELIKFVHLQRCLSSSPSLTKVLANPKPWPDLTMEFD